MVIRHALLTCVACALELSPVLVMELIDDVGDLPA